MATITRHPKPSGQPVSAALVPQALLTMRTLVALSGMCETTLRRSKATDPTFPVAVRVGRAGVRYRAEEVTAWLAKQAPVSKP